MQVKFIFSNYRKKHWWLPILDFFITQIEFPLTYLFLGMLLVSFVIYPIVMVKFFAGLGVFTLVWMYYYISQERDLEFVYGIIYSYFAFFFLTGSSLGLPDGAQRPLADALTPAYGINIESGRVRWQRRTLL